MGLMIRAATEEDAAAIAAIYAPYVEASTVTFELEAPDAATMARRMAEIQTRGLPYLVADEDGVVAAYAYAGPYRPRAAYRFTVEDSIYVREQYARRGLGRQLLIALIEQCRAAGCHRMVAGMGGENEASIALHAALGFVRVGVLREVGYKFDQWVDVTLMQRGL